MPVLSGAALGHGRALVGDMDAFRSFEMASLRRLRQNAHMQQGWRVVAPPTCAQLTGSRPMQDDTIIPVLSSIAVAA